MPELQLKTIPVNKILANFTQPRERFDKEKIKELAESILSNSLINPINVRFYKNGKYMIVSGERRWQAHKVAGLKNIQAFVKEYKDKVQEMIESLIENWQREDLTSIEKENCVWNLWKTGKFETQKELAKKLGTSWKVVNSLIYAKQERGKLHATLTKNISTRTLVDTQGLEKRDKERILKKIEEGKLPITGKSVREHTKIIKEAPKEVSGALLSDEISVGQAESLSKIHSDKAREQALKQVKQHKETAKRYEHIADIIPELKERAKPEISEALKKKFQSTQRIIFEHLHDAQMGVMKSHKSLKKANEMLNQLISKSFEDGLDKKTLATTIQQMKGISDKISQFDIVTERFDELKDTFIERVEDKLEELK